MWCMTSYHVHLHHTLEVAGHILLCIFDGRIKGLFNFSSSISSYAYGTTQYVTIRYDIYRIFYIPVNFAFNIPHYVTSYMHHIGKKESKKEILKKEKKDCKKFSGIRTRTLRIS